MQTLQTETEAIDKVLDHHLKAFMENDIEEIMKDYTEKSEVWTPDGAIVGLEGISSFFAYVFTLLPKDSTKLQLKQKLVKEDLVYIAWNAESDVVSIPTGVDCFEIKDGKIILQTTGAHIVQK